MKKISLLGVTLAIVLLMITPSARACTTAIVSGKFTPDGRPLLLKHRDTDALQNRLMYFQDGRYYYIGLVDSKDTLGKEVWAGCNSAGFAIMNSADYNLNLKDTASLKDREGLLMKQALQTCTSVDDFEAMLRALPTPLGVDANFGVIDARGGAAYFETGNYCFKKIDVNDSLAAPFGYMIRTNFAFSGAREEDYGLIRYRTADELFYMASATRDLTPRFILQKVSRCLKHSLTKTDLTADVPKSSEQPRYVAFRDYIPRFSSSATVLVQGVRRGDPPESATMWTILGFQLCSIAVPAWVGGGEHLPSILLADLSGNAPLCKMALKLKEKCFPISREAGRDYLNLSAVINQQNDGILQKLLPVEEQILRTTEETLPRLRQNGFNRREAEKFYRWVETKVADEYTRLFGPSLN
jgi:hypothetical protein